MSENLPDPANDETLTMSGYEWWAYRRRIEAEAARDALAALRVQVEGLEIKADFGDNWDKPNVVCGHVDGPCGFRAAVLALFDAAAKP